MPSYLGRGQVFSGLVSYVGDGDSLCVAVGPKAAEWVEVRLEDFYAPELNAPGGREAKAALERATEGKALSCRASHRSYDRIVAMCWLGTVSVGDLMRKRIVEGGNGHSASR